MPDDLDPAQVVGAIPNSTDSTFARINFDNQTLKFLEDGNMQKIDDYFVRTVIWRHLIYQLIKCKIDPLQYIKILVINLPNEKVEQNCIGALEHLVPTIV